MALVRNSSDGKVMRKKVVVAKERPFMLKDYLMEDMSSCSSSGFKSYPRRQCCTTVRFLMDIDLKSRERPKIRSETSAAASTTMSALQRASVAFINAVKTLQFPSVKSASPAATGKGVLSRSFSRKLLKRSFWKKNGNEEPDRRCRLFGELLGEKERPSDENTQHSITSTITASRLSTSTTSSNSNSYSYSSGEIDFSPDTLRGDDIGGKSDLLHEKKVNKRVGVTVGHESTEAATTPCSGQNSEVWQNHEEKQQFSPVSVLDCPFEDEEEEEDSSSQFKRSHVRVEEGTKQKLMQKIERFERLAILDPVDLEKRIALSEHCTSISTKIKVKERQKGCRTEQELEALLKQVKATSPHIKFVADNLLLDFFSERLVEDNALCEQDLLTEARDWVNGKPRELLLGWEVQEGREMYIRDLEKGGRCKETTSLQEKEDVAVELDSEIWTSLVNELLLDL